jgi:hypothetical protein
MSRFFIRAFVASAFAAAAAHADLPREYRVALVQISYTDAPAVYSRLQLLAAVAEIQDYYSTISNLHLNLEIAMSSLDFKAPSSYFIGIDSKGNSYPVAGHTSLVEQVALAANGSDHIDFSHIDGIMIVSSFCACDYTLGSSLMVSRPPVSGTFEVAYDFECGPDPRLAPPGPSGVRWGPWAHELGHMIGIHAGNWAGHPSGYADGYALMDSCYPSSTSAYSVLGPALMTGDKTMFNGWLLLLLGHKRLPCLKLTVLVSL